MLHFKLKGMTSKNLISFFPEYGHVGIESRMQQHGSKHFSLRPPPSRPCWMGSKDQNSISEHGRVEYQIKWNHKCRNMQTHIFFLKVVMLHIKLKGKEHRAPCNHIFCPYTHPKKYECGHFAYQIKGKEV